MMNIETRTDSTVLQKALYALERELKRSVKELAVQYDRAGNLSKNPHGQKCSLKHTHGVLQNIEKSIKQSIDEVDEEWGLSIDDAEAACCGWSGMTGEERMNARWVGKKGK